MGQQYLNSKGTRLRGFSGEKLKMKASDRQIRELEQLNHKLELSVV